MQPEHHSNLGWASYVEQLESGKLLLSSKTLCMYIIKMYHQSPEKTSMDCREWVSVRVGKRNALTWKIRVL